MLSAIFGSSAKVKILNFFLLHPEKNANIGEISKISGLPTASARRETENFVKIGLIKEIEEVANKESKAKKTSGKTRYFQAATTCILYPEIKALLVKARVLPVQKLLDSLGKVCSLKLLLLTGAFINRSDAPTDLLIVGAPPRQALMTLIAELEKSLKQEINFTVLSEKEYNYRQEVMDIFLYNILEGENMVLLDKLF